MRLQTGTLLHGDTYKIEKVLGQGSFGITYLAVHMALERKVCIKEFFMKEINTRNVDGSITGMTDGSLSYNYGQKFKKEALNLSRLDHPNIVHVTDSFEENGTYYYVMDYIDGDNLNDYLKSHKVTQVEALSIIRDVATALMYMHEEKKMLHLDLKPGNIMRRHGDGHIFLIDFGLSKHYSSDGQPETSTSIGLGTAGYAPIEQANQMKSGEFRPTIDVYALGATLFKLLTGETPPQASEIVSDDELIESKLRANGITGPIIDVVVNAMLPNVKKRTQSVKAFLDDLPYGTEEKPAKPKPKAKKKPTAKPKAKPETVGSSKSEETEVLGGQEKGKDTSVILGVASKDSVEVDNNNEEEYDELPQTGFIEAIRCGFNEKLWFDLGRSRRSEFWYFALVCVSFFIISVLFTDSESRFSNHIFNIVGFYVGVALLCATVRRLHDSGHSGYWSLFVSPVPLTIGGVFALLMPGASDITFIVMMLLLFVPSAYLIYLCCQDSDKGDNEYGEATKYVPKKEKGKEEGEVDDESDNSSWKSFVSVGILVCLFVLPFAFRNCENKGKTSGKQETSQSSTKMVKPQSVDLGLSVEWADRNIGSKNISDIGYYYWWGGVNPISNLSNPSDVFDYNEETGTYIKYNTPGVVVDSLSDVACMTLGEEWRVPRPDELYELVTMCTWEDTVYGGVKGYKVVGKNGAWIFLPYIFNNEDNLLMGSYMSNRISDNNVNNFYSLIFSDKPFDDNVNYRVMEVERQSACVVRAVRAKK